MSAGRKCLGDRVIVCGEPYRASRLAPGDIVPDALVKEAGGPRAFRVVCLDGGDVVLRNLRHRDIFVVEPLVGMVGAYRLITPALSCCEPG